MKEGKEGRKEGRKCYEGGKKERKKGRKEGSKEGNERKEERTIGRKDIHLSFCPWILSKYHNLDLQFLSHPQMNELIMLRLSVLVVFGATDNPLPSVWRFAF